MFTWLSRLRNRDYSQATEAGLRKRAILFFSVAIVVLTMMGITLWLEREQCALANAVSCFFSPDEADSAPDAPAGAYGAEAVPASP